jgi:HPt (histidine-containing phosphotransfer) domain-containing protein
LARELIEIFLEEWPNLLAATREAVEQNDIIALERAIHTMKGALGYFSSGGAMQATLRLQQMWVNGDLSEAQPTLAALEASAELLTTQLREFRVACIGKGT